jgi:hypothetical protein
MEGVVAPAHIAVPVERSSCPGVDSYTLTDLASL